MYRDRDALVSKEGIIFRVMGYDHPPGAYVCDVEYAPESVYRSPDPRSPRVGRRGERYYKFYFDGGLRFVEERYPQYTVYHEPLGRRLVGLREDQVAEARLPGDGLERLYHSDRDDVVVRALREVLDYVLEVSSLGIGDFGVFGSLLHDFYHPEYSDLDFVVYGRERVRELVEVLAELYRDPSSLLDNEFPRYAYYHSWRFSNYSPEEFLRHQERKAIYAVYKRKLRERRFKVEFEPVRDWSEIENEYERVERIERLGWMEASIEVVDASDSYFMPSIYRVLVLEARGPRGCDEVERVISYVEEFRMQLEEGERGVVVGWLERVSLKREGDFYQVALSYGPRYFEQVLKSLEI